MAFKSKYQGKVQEVLFNDEFIDLLFKNGIPSYIKDQFRFERALELLKYPKNKTIFELGAFPGTGFYYFGEFNDIIGIGKTNIDFSKKAINLGHKLIDVDFEDIKKGDIPVQADVVLAMEVLEHIRMPHKFIEVILDTIKPGGLLYLTTNNQSYIGYLVKLLFNKEILDPIESENTFYPGHCRYYSLKELVRIFDKFGFVILESNYINFLPKYKLYKSEKFGFIKNVFVKLLPKRFSTHIEILIKKPE
jgi:SAM-dependent methyltransferase